MHRTQEVISAFQIVKKATATGCRQRDFPSLTIKKEKLLNPQSGRRTVSVISFLIKAQHALKQVTVPAERATTDDFT